MKALKTIDLGNGNTIEVFGQDGLPITDIEGFLDFTVGLRYVTWELDIDRVCFDSVKEGRNAAFDLIKTDDGYVLGEQIQDYDQATDGVIIVSNTPCLWDDAEDSLLEVNHFVKGEIKRVRLTYEGETSWYWYSDSCDASLEDGLTQEQIKLITE